MKQQKLFAGILVVLVGLSIYGLTQNKGFFNLKSNYAAVGSLSYSSPYPKCQTGEQILNLSQDVKRLEKEVLDLPKTTATVKKELAKAKALLTKTTATANSVSKTYEAQRVKYSKLIQTQAATIRGLESQISKTTNKTTLTSLQKKLLSAMKTQAGYMSALKSISEKYKESQNAKFEADQKYNELNTKYNELTDSNAIATLNSKYAEAKALLSEFSSLAECPSKENATTQCNDDVDNDRDGKADCSDSDCFNSTACKVISIDPPSNPGTEPKLIYYEANCSDGQDNDGNGVTDCRDDACRGSNACSSTDDYCPVIPFGDNGDQVQPDCEDPDCRSTEASCQNNSTPTGPGSGNPGMGNRPAPEGGSEKGCDLCDNTADDDGDGLIDDEDPDCFDTRMDRTMDTDGCLMCDPQSGSYIYQCGGPSGTNDKCCYDGSKATEKCNEIPMCSGEDVCSEMVSEWRELKFQSIALTAEEGGPGSCGNTTQSSLRKKMSDIMEKLETSCPGTYPSFSWTVSGYVIDAPVDGVVKKVDGVRVDFLDGTYTYYTRNQWERQMRLSRVAAGCGINQI